MGSLDFLRPITSKLPEVASPKYPPALNERLIWTALALIAFFIMYNVTAVGVQENAGGLDFLQIVTASKIGSLITTGIGPIVLASIFLQLFAGAKIINVDLTNPEEKATFHGVQKLLALFLSIFEAAVFVLFSKIALGTLIFGSVAATQAFVIVQIALGSIVLLFLDEVVSKYGIGSGISLFIAGGVSYSIVAGFLLIITGSGGVIEDLGAGGANALSNVLLDLTPVFFTILVFAIVVYAEGMKVEIPLAFDRARGLGGRFPIKFLYVSNIPVILASALMLNLQFFSLTLRDISLKIGEFNIIHAIGYVDAGGRLADGLLYFISPIYVGSQIDVFTYMGAMLGTTTPILALPQVLHIFTYTIFLMGLCIIFGVFWVETANMGPKAVAEQLDKSGLQIPGFRRDPRIVEKVLERYIPTITILGSAFVGLLAALADLTGALGTGTGILLTVGILYKMYEDLRSKQAFGMNSAISGFLEG
ncbi:preprotein translocase subunit SecY [Candidatus Micrarchaeota archaeon CG1_02_47_40]|nr:MAG: preprotein translocase subunit SecY [Candidatus Micrarchaeota archaeon CG1_02_47_40]